MNSLLDQLGTNLHHLTKHNYLELDQLNKEYDELQLNFPDVESLIIAQRHSNVHLWSEIHTYRSLLINLSSLTGETRWNSSSPSMINIENTTGFKVHRHAGLVYVRI